MYSNELVCQILEFLDSNINRKISIQEIVLKFSYDRYYIMKRFKKEMGVSILLYVNQMRIYHSIFDIQKTNFSVTRIAIENGFSSLEYFSEMFFKIMGVSPRVYKNYYCCRFKVSEQELEAIRSHWADLQSFVNFVGDYKKNRKPLQAPVLKRSIFN